MLSNFTKNAVQIAVDRVGGPTKAAHLVGVSNTAVHAWIRARKVSNIDFARTLAKASEVPLAELRPTL